jgi:hypothetical protein
VKKMETLAEQYRRFTRLQVALDARRPWTLYYGDKPIRLTTAELFSWKTLVLRVIEQALVVLSSGANRGWLVHLQGLIDQLNNETKEAPQ